MSLFNFWRDRCDPAREYGEELAPINESMDAPISLTLLIADDVDGTRMKNQIASLDDDERVHVQWRNATITARAGTFKGWLGLGDFERSRR